MSSEQEKSRPDGWLRMSGRGCTTAFLVLQALHQLVEMRIPLGCERVGVGSKMRIDVFALRRQEFVRHHAKELGNQFHRYILPLFSLAVRT